ncbi:MAG TPA: hypothetical protein VLY63_11485, partial [Anaerolineae bacterium]|nr:hypothetical protein [Anaerolineae bacterium]
VDCLDLQDVRSSWGRPIAGCGGQSRRLYRVEVPPHAPSCPAAAPAGGGTGAQARIGARPLEYRGAERCGTSAMGNSDQRGSAG